jgi:DNA polymerase-3 subunit epsilon
MLAPRPRPGRAPVLLDDVRLGDLDVLVLDCQATAAAPRGHLLELGWTRVRSGECPPRACVIRLPEREHVPPAVARITGISDAVARRGIDVDAAWRALRDEATRFTRQPAPAVAHYARFEAGFLQCWASQAPPLDLVCTHEIARRLFPDLPRCSLRALAGFLGHGVGTLRRSADHVEATAFVWRELVERLEPRGVSTWRELHAWLDTPVARPRAACRAWPMPRPLRLALPDAPGVYRLLRTNGDVLYVGKAASLHARVNSHFRQQHGLHERTLEMLSQAQGVSFEVTPSALEAALLEPDEIKRHSPPYNVALTGEGRQVWFATPAFRSCHDRPSRRHRLGPFTSREPLDGLAALARGDRTALGDGRWAPAASVFHEGYARLRAAHPELSRADVEQCARLMQLGTRLWREGRRERDAERDEPAESGRTTPRWTPESVQQSLEWLAIRAALTVRRARWFTRLLNASVVWSEPGVEAARLIVVENGDIALRATVAPGAAPPVPTRPPLGGAACRARFTVARLDRLRVLTTEFKRLADEGHPLAIRFDRGPVLTGARLARALTWV